MTTQITKTWFVDGKIIEQVIPESEIYKRPWVGLTDAEVDNIVAYPWGETKNWIKAVEDALKEKNA